MSPYKVWFIDQLNEVLSRHFSGVVDYHFLDSFLREYLRGVLNSHVWCSMLLTTSFEETYAAITVSNTPRSKSDDVVKTEGESKSHSYQKNNMSSLT